MAEDVTGPSDDEIFDSFDRISGCVPPSAKPRTEAVVRQVLALCIDRTSPTHPKKITTAQELVHNCSGIETPENGRTYMHRIGGKEIGWSRVPGFKLRRNKKAYDWPNGKLELLFDRTAYCEGRPVPGGYSVRYDHLDDI